MRDPISRQIWVERATWLAERELGGDPHAGDRGAASVSTGVVFTTPGQPPRFLALRGWELPTGAQWAALPAATLVDWFYRAQPLAGTPTPAAPEPPAASATDDGGASSREDAPTTPAPMWARFMAAPETEE